MYCNPTEQKQENREEALQYKKNSAIL